MKEAAMYKLFVETSGKRARLVPSHSVLGVAERNFGEIDTATALSNIDSLDQAIREMLEDKGVEDTELYVVTLPDNLLPNRPYAVAPAEGQEPEVQEPGSGNKGLDENKGPTESLKEPEKEPAKEPAKEPVKEPVKEPKPENEKKA